jgi:hypothetical protein
MFNNITYIRIKNNKNAGIKIIRNLGILNKFLNGARITTIKPAKLLIKKRGYRETLFQKSFIYKVEIIGYFLIIIYATSNLFSNLFDT